MAAESEGEEATSEEPEVLGLQHRLLSEVGSDFCIGVIRAQREGQEVSSQLIGIAELDGSLLVAVPHSAWNRVVARRHLPAKSLTRATLVEVGAASDDDRAVPHPVWKVKVWVGLLNPALNDSVQIGSEDAGAEMIFVVAGSGASAAGPVPAVPLASALLAVAGEHFAFVSAQGEPAASVAGSTVPERLDKVESVLGELRQGLDSLLQRLPHGGAPPAEAEGDRTRGRPSAMKPKVSEAPHAPQLPARGSAVAVGPALPGLDPAVVEAARAAGVPEAQLRRMSKLTQDARNLAPEPRGRGNDPLDDEPSEEEDPGGGAGSSDPVKQAVVKMSRILDVLHRDRKAANLEDLLDKAEGGDGGQGSSGSRSKAAAYNRLRTMLVKNPQEISKSIEELIAEDFLLSQGGPGQEAARCTVRGWIEHRSLLQSFPGPIRNAWLLGGIVDAINSGEVERAKSMALLGVAALDQAAIDGSWVIASEIGLERAPPFGSFSRPRVLDTYESKQTKILDSRWMSVLMARLKERDSFHTANKNLGQQSGVQPSGAGGGAPNTPPSGGGGAEDKGPRQREGKGKGKDKKGDKEKRVRFADCVLAPTPEPADLAVPRQRSCRGALFGLAVEPPLHPQLPHVLRGTSLGLVLLGLLDDSEHGLGRCLCPTRSSTCLGPELGMWLGAEVSPAQHAAIDALFESVALWNAEPEVGPAEMGRSASKVEGTEDLLRALRMQLSSSPPGRGKVCGKLSFQVPCYARAVDPSRLRFVGIPTFDPMPFLDAETRALYARPLDYVSPLPEGITAPRVAVRTKPGKTVAFLKALDDTKRLALVPRQELLSEQRNGVFAVIKDGQRDRLVLDARPPNLVEGGRDRWVGTLGSLDQIQHLHLPPGYILNIFTEDLREFYHAFVIGGQRLHRNALALCLPGESLASMSVCSRAMHGLQLVPCLATMAMGDTHAVNFGQASHLSLLLRTGKLTINDFLMLKGRPRRSPELSAGLLIDDFILLEPTPVDRPSSSEPSRGEQIIQAVREAYVEAELPRHEGKAEYKVTRAKFWGGDLDGEKGLLRPNPHRTIPLAHLLLGAVELGFSTVGLLETFSGGLVSAFQVRRRLLSVLDAVYKEQRGREPRDIVRVRGALCSEFLVASALLCLADADLRAPGAPVLILSDASNHKEAAVAASIPEGLSLELTRHGLQKGLWSRLLSPYSAYLRGKGEPEPELSELPEEEYKSHPLWEHMCSFLPFRLWGSVVKVCKQRHINLGELRAALRAEDRAGRIWPGRRFLQLIDSQVAAACLVKGRSSSSALNWELKRSLGPHLTSRVRPSYGFICSAANVSDDPTRDVPIRAPVGPEPPWWKPACDGDFAELDAWLSDRGMHLDQMRDIPDVCELLPDAPLDLPSEDPGRLMRRNKGSEAYAQALLERKAIGAADLLQLFLRLPREVSARAVFKERRGITFSAGMFIHGGVAGLRNTCSEHPHSISAFCRYIKLCHPSIRFTTFSVLQNSPAMPHVDASNMLGEPNLVLPLSRFRGGGLWVECEGGSMLIKHKGRQIGGEVLPVHSQAVVFDPHKLHCTRPWRGRRVVLVAFCLRGTERLTDEQKATLEKLGFSLPDGIPSESLPEAPANRRDESFPLHAEQALDGCLGESRKCLESIRAKYAIDDFVPVAAPSVLASTRKPLGSLRVEPPLFRAGSPSVEPPSAGALFQKASHFSVPQGCPSMSQIPLDCKTVDFLLSLPPGRFVYSSSFPDLGSALRTGRGWLDLFSGSRGVAKALARAAPCWILCYDIAHSASENLRDLSVQREIVYLFEAGAFLGFFASPDCGSFSTAVVPPVRSREHPEGSPQLSGWKRDKLLQDNAQLEFLADLVRICIDNSLLYMLENPHNSWIWKQPCWSGLRSDAGPWDFSFDMCVFGTPWRKATRIRSNGQLRGKTLRCSGNHNHRVLRGRESVSGVSWCKLAQPFPRRLSALLANAMTQDAARCSENRPLDIVRCAKCCGARFGEARNPGPRPRRPRPDCVLAQVPLVEPATAALQKSVWDSFVVWVWDGAGEGSSETLSAHPDLLVELLTAYGQVLYSGGKPLQHYRQLLAVSQRRVPKCRATIRTAWEMLSRWERLEPTQHRPPLPEPLLEAMCSLALAWFWRRWAAVALLGFYGCCRVGEVLRARRSDLLLPSDLLRSDGRIFLKIRDPKSRGRGPRVQHATVVLGPEFVAFFTEVFGDLPRNAPLFYGSPYVFRKRWDTLLGALGVARSFKLTPGSLRGGGAVALYQAGVTVSELQWKMRLQHQTTLGYYLQEVSAVSIFPALPKHAREAVTAARAVLVEFLLPARNTGSAALPTKALTEEEHENEEFLLPARNTGSAALPTKALTEEEHENEV
ncbi:unnamed protein product [Symbiodinium sp. CCMP2592]|nr:unnamed protein product [Symbiodinium sp. CCMP2592]